MAERVLAYHQRNVAQPHEARSALPNVVRVCLPSGGEPRDLGRCDDSMNTKLSVEASDLMRLCRASTSIFLSYLFRCDKHAYPYLRTETPLSGWLFFHLCDNFALAS